MASSIQFDGTEILTSAYLPRFIKHESVGERQLITLPLAREDGEILIAERRGKKIIRLQGMLSASSQDNLDAAINAFEELFSRPEKNLDISWNGGTLRYVATCTKHEFDRDHYHLSAVPWTAEFTVLTGAGKATSTTTALSAHGVTVTTPGTDSFTMTGSKPARPKITLKGANFSGSHRGVEYKNTDTGEKIVFCLPSGFFGNTDIVEIDCDAKTVRYSQDNGSTYVNENFYGVFPKFKIGTNNVQITAGDIVNQSSAETALSNLATLPSADATTKRVAQSFFVPYTDATFRSATLAIKKTGTPGNLTVELCQDSSGKPGAAITNASVTVAHAAVGTSLAYVTFSFTDAVTLTANTKYWLQIKAAATVDGSNYYSWGGQTGIYPKGKAKSSSDSGSTYADILSGLALGFRVNMGGISAAGTVNHTVVYTPLYL